MLPRLAVALLVGAGLGLVGVLFQQCCVIRWRNRPPLASPPARSWDNGHHVMAIPGVLASQFAALAGACLVRAGVWRLVGKRLSPVTLIRRGWWSAFTVARLTS